MGCCLLHFEIILNHSAVVVNKGQSPYRSHSWTLLGDVNGGLLLELGGCGEAVALRSSARGACAPGGTCGLEAMRLGRVLQAALLDPAGGCPRRSPEVLAQPSGSVALCRGLPSNDQFSFASFPVIS